MSFHVHASGKCTYTQSVAVHQLWHNTILTCEISETKGTDWTTVSTEEHSNDCGKCPAHPTESYKSKSTLTAVWCGFVNRCFKPEQIGKQEEDARGKYLASEEKSFR